MNNNGKSYRWNIYKSLCTSRWVVWNTGWVWLEPLRFDTWQEAIDYVNGKGKS